MTALYRFGDARDGAPEQPATTLAALAAIDGIESSNTFNQDVAASSDVRRLWAEDGPPSGLAMVGLLPSRVELGLNPSHGGHGQGP